MRRGKRLHTGRSRNDQVALDMRLYVKKEIKEIIKADPWLYEGADLYKSRENLRCGYAGLHPSAARTADRPLHII